MAEQFLCSPISVIPVTADRVWSGLHSTNTNAFKVEALQFQASLGADSEF